MNALLQLAERCEQATAQEQRFLLLEAHRVIFTPPSDDETAWLKWRREKAVFESLIFSGGYVDAALALVPENWASEVQFWPMLPAPAATVTLLQCSEKRFGKQLVWGHGSPDLQIRAKAATRALAICAAALRARASMEKNDG